MRVMQPMGLRSRLLAGELLTVGQVRSVLSYLHQVGLCMCHVCFKRDLWQTGVHPAHRRAVQCGSCQTQQAFQSLFFIVAVFCLNMQCHASYPDGLFVCYGQDVALMLTGLCCSRTAVLPLYHT